ncbi:coiled-coil domain-containing protein 18-like isoform X2 [Homarus americanus]|uniref:coiled-coil domain-containing protein 18-like isoform X2 n=1 Tax=Homarus americanus TaxID=6706 RepID=UPI001C48CFE5|nr:coiled-coil domain-containing protein 18-like isoform X2 [Homarus americanus]XP_042217465.1 coiled-coil domain-containing protein 18-like isoform X2 [Homarus americanus]XP_042217466.1 coiled-coil domain-containing protein 18-like isoform X2 [Homarus americanus]XP_042217467.1 coiled-coil domain-containing protein 18-like isoform X2 [Homarus americanus]
MSHGESCAGVVGSGVGGHKKLRRKRKELDALVPEDKVRRKSSSASHHDLLRSDSEDPEADFSGVAVLGKRMLGGGHQGGIWACLPGACTLLLLLTTLVGVGAALRLLMLTRRDLDSLHSRINSVEASSSELPAKFHESHVRLQELEKNQSALWAAVTQISSSLAATTKRVEQLESDVKRIKDSLSSAPQLSSLPKDVVDLQGSVATFGSTLQDVQSSLKVVKQDHEKLSSNVKEATNALDNFKEEISHLQNQTLMDVGREGGGKGATLGETVVSLRTNMNSLSSAITTINASVISHAKETSANKQKLESIQQSNTDLSNVSQRLSNLESWHRKIDPTLPSQISNLTTALTQLQETTDQHAHTLQNLTQSVDVVKGVERKLEGSQVQLASGVSELKQQLQKMEQQVATMASAVSNPSPAANNETHIRKQRLIHSDSGASRDSRGP